MGMNSTPDHTTPAPPARCDLYWRPLILSAGAMAVGLLAFFAVLDIVKLQGPGIRGEAISYMFLFFWLPAITIYNSRYPSWRMAAVIVAFALLAFWIGATAVLFGVLSDPDSAVTIFAGIAASFTISLGTVVVSRRLWPPTDISPVYARPTKSRGWLGVLGRVAAFIILGYIFANATGVLFLSFEIDCRCLGPAIWFTGFVPAALIAMKRGGGHREWAITLLGSLFAYALTVAGVAVGSQIFLAWELRDNLAGGFTAVFGGMAPGLIVLWLLAFRSDKVAAAGAQEPPA